MTVWVCIFAFTDEGSSPDTSPVSFIDFKRGIRYESTTYYYIGHGVYFNECHLCAVQGINHADGKEKISVVSVSNAYTLDDLSNALSRKADEQGATSFKILSTTGNNRLHGVAEI